MNAIYEVLNTLPEVATITLIVIFVLIVLQEAVNGFHDSANAVATVIYSNSMKPNHAIWLSALMNFLGVLLGGTAVAFGLVFLLPKEMVAGINTIHEASLMLALIITAVGWNLATWWYGIPNSTTHTYIGSVIGVSIAHAMLVGTPLADAVNWHQGQKIMTTLLLSPVFGFVLAWLLYKLVMVFFKNPEMFEPHQPGKIPSNAVRFPLIGGLIGVSFLHGSNDGQKSIGLMLMVLMGLAPGFYAIDPVKDQASYDRTIAVIEEIEDVVKPLIGDPRTPRAQHFFDELEHIRDTAERDFANKPLSEEEMITFRKEILDVHTELSKFMKNSDAHNLVSEEDYAKLEDAWKATSKLIETVPFWLILLSAIALGTGTMIGYKKIVETLGEKMGDKHMSAAQGLAAQASAMAAIAAADVGGVPVSTTHVLTAGVTGAVQSSGDQVQWNTIGRILITWFTTLPGTVIVSFVMGLILHFALV